MGDCYYHGSYGGHNCPECEEERRRKVPQGTIIPDRDDYIARLQMNIKEHNLPLGLDMDGKPLKRKE